jgi:hypothetical protein
MPIAPPYMVSPPSALMSKFAVIKHAFLSAIRELMNPPAPARRGIGFTADLE